MLFSQVDSQVLSLSNQPVQSAEEEFQKKSFADFRFAFPATSTSPFATDCELSVAVVWLDTADEVDEPLCAVDAPLAGFLSADLLVVDDFPFPVSSPFPFPFVPLPAFPSPLPDPVPFPAELLPLATDPDFELGFVVPGGVGFRRGVVSADLVFDGICDG